MSISHWLFLVGVAVLTALLLCVSLSARPQTRAYRLARRVFWAVVFLQGANSLGLLGLNAVNAAAVAALGLPGCAALLTLALL